MGAVVILEKPIGEKRLISDIHAAEIFALFAMSRRFTFELALR